MVEAAEQEEEEEEKETLAEVRNRERERLPPHRHDVQQQTDEPKGVAEVEEVEVEEVA